MTKKPRKKNPQDTTFRNINALKYRLTRLSDNVAILESDLLRRVVDLENWNRRDCAAAGLLQDRVADLANRVTALEEWTQTAARRTDST